MRTCAAIAMLAGIAWFLSVLGPRVVEWIGRILMLAPVVLLIAGALLQKEEA